MQPSKRVTTAAAPSPGRKVRVDPKTIPCTDPATGQSLGEVRAMDRDDVARRVARARLAQQAWAKTGFAERRRVLRALLDAILEQADELCEVICRDAGKTLENAMVGEIWPIAEKIRWTMKYGERYLRPEKVPSGLLVHKRARKEFHPLGVIGVICPWNFPLQNILGPTIPALMAGNAAVVKVSEWVSWSAARFQRLLDDVFDRTGHSRDLVQLVVGYGETGAALVTSGVDKIVFTGSMANGRRVLEGAAKNLTPVVLELGGKDPMIVCDDANLEQAVHGALSGVFIASGQMCLAAERIYVHERIYDRFVERVVAEASRLRQGAPLGQGEGRPTIDVGAMTMPGQLDIVERLVDEAVSRGAKLRLGGRRRAGTGQFFAPTILSDVDHSMAIVRDETFGPVMSILRFRSDAEVVTLANDTPYGLGSTVYSTDHRRARRIAERLVAGSTCVNDWAVTYMAQSLPFGGVNGSGFGRLNGVEGLRACTNIKSVLDDRLPLHQPVKLYPVGPGDYPRTREAIRLIYGNGVGARLAAAWNLGKTFLSGKS